MAGNTVGRRVAVTPAVYERRRRVSQLYLRGVSQADMAKMEGVTPTTIHKDIEFVRAQVLAACEERVKMKMEIELAKIDHVEKTAWERFEESCKNSETIHTTTVRRLPRKQQQEQSADSRFAGMPVGLVNNGMESHAIKRGHEKKLKRERPQQQQVDPLELVEVSEDVTVKGQVGDPRWIDQVRWCIETRCKILGIIKPDKHVNTTQNNFLVDWDKLYERGKVQDMTEAIQALPRESHGITMPSPQEVTVQAEVVSDGTT